MGTTAMGRSHKRWPEALKREIVAASLAPGASVSVVARQYDVNANQVFSWRKRYREEARPPSNPTAPQLVPVVIKADQEVGAAQPLAVAEKIETRRTPKRNWRWPEPKPPMIKP
jgi:transposase